MGSIEYIRANYEHMTDIEMSKVLMISPRKVRQIRDKIGLKKKSSPHKYSAEQLTFLSQNRPNMNMHEMAKTFNARFSTDLQPMMLARVCRQHGYKCNLSLSELNTTTETNSERSGGRNRTLIKLKDGTWKEKARFLYEHYHSVTLSQEDMIVFLDGNKRNFAENNLYRVSRSINMIMSAFGWYRNNKDFTLTALKWCELHELANKKQ